MSQENIIKFAVNTVEEIVETMYNKVSANVPKPTHKELFKAAAMAEISRRIFRRATDIEEDYLKSKRVK